MIPQESERIALLGTVFFENMASLIFRSWLFGVYILTFMISMHIILQKENNGWAYIGLIGLLLAGFVMTALDTFANFVFNFLLVKYALVVSLPGGLIAQEIAANLKSSAMNILQSYSGNFIFLIADTAIVWRAWALWAHNKLIKWTLFIILLADIGTSIADAVVDNEANIHMSKNAVTMDSLSAALNLTVNIVATLLIAHRAWKYHQSTHVVLRNKKTKAQEILLLMVESGAVFGVMQITDIIFTALDIHTASLSPVDNATLFIEALYLYSAVLNLVALVILIQTRNTYDHSFHLEDDSSLEINSVPNVS
ncbi:hypothetical protein BT96DRAFT_977550 [Gymnopus androsaceus JB14]|uniref:Uncharacterized protein n=1 Tax=Gymnopus androsaceus JB14 TaxID=1447944 RepID=A0A6A4HEK3_9AGAR|nr:hypothetical protein BT96DRAFT_977550 [Gymnopus androsaceus JB14]